MHGTIGIMANTSSRALRLLSLLQNHRFWPGAELADRLGVSPRTLRRDVDRLRELGYPVTAHPGVDGGYQLASGAALPPLVVDDEEAVALAVGLRLATQGAPVRMTTGQGTTRQQTPGQGTTGQGTTGDPTGQETTGQRTNSQGTGQETTGQQTSSQETTSQEATVQRTAGRETGQEAAGQDDADHDTVAEAAARALAKVTQVMPARLRRRVEAVADMTESASWGAARAGQAAVIDPDVLAGAALACRDTERLRFAYGAASGERTERHVEPHRLVALDGRWYLVAYDLTRNDWRTFRLDRVIGAPQPTGARFRPRALPAADAVEFVRRSANTAPGMWQVTAMIDAPAATIRDRIGRWVRIQEDGPDRCLVTMTPGGHLDSAVIALGMSGADFRVLSPPELTERIADWGDRFTRATRAAAPPAGKLL